MNPAIPEVMLSSSKQPADEPYPPSAFPEAVQNIPWNFSSTVTFDLSRDDQNCARHSSIVTFGITLNHLEYVGESLWLPELFELRANERSCSN